MPAGVEPPGWILKSWNCSFELANVTTTFGKEDSDCLIPFRSVSKHHAVMTWDVKKQHYKIKEAPFSLGTFVNDSRIGVRTIILMLGDTIRFGADSPTFRVEVKEKEKEFVSPRKTLSTVHDMEKEEEGYWPEQTQNQTVVSNNTPFVVTPLAPPQMKSTPKQPAPKITSYEPPALREESPLIRASRDLSLSRSSIEELRGNRASTPSSSSRADSNTRGMRNKGPKGSALYGQPTWWGEEEVVHDNYPPATLDINHPPPRRTPKHSHSTEFDPFDGYSDRHDYVAEYPAPPPPRGERDYARERSYNGNNNHHYNESPGRPVSYDDDKCSERSYDRFTDRSYPPPEDKRNNRYAQPRYEERVYTPPPSKPGMAFQITFDEPKAPSPRHPGKKKKGTPPKPDNDDKKSNVSAHSDRSRKSNDSNRSSEKLSDKISDRGSEKGSEKGSDVNSDMKIDDIEVSLPEEAVSNEGEKSKSDEEVSQSSGSQTDVHTEDPAIKKELTQWANSLFKTRDYVPVFSIHDSVKDGRTLAQLLHCIADEKVSDLTKDPKLRVEILPNIDKCLAFSKQHNLIVGDVASRDIVRGNDLQITILLEQLRAAHRRKLERPSIPKSDETKAPPHVTPNLASAMPHHTHDHTTHDHPSDHTLSDHTLSDHTTHDHTLSDHTHDHTLSDHTLEDVVTRQETPVQLDWNISRVWLRHLLSEAELTDDEGVLPFRRNKTLAAPPRVKRAHNHTSVETGDKPTAQLEKMLLHTLNDLTTQLKHKIDKSAVYSLHIKEELDSLAGNNAPEDFSPNSISGPPPPGSDNNVIPDSDITEALKNLRFLERKLAEIEENLIHVRNESIPTLVRKGSEKSKKKKKGLSGIFKKDPTKDLAGLKGASSLASVNSQTSERDSGLASGGPGPHSGAGSQQKVTNIT